MVMDLAIYSIAVIGGYALTRFITEQTSFHLRLKGLWIHHWILASLLMSLLFVFEVNLPGVWGLLTGVALEGLSRKNWSIKDRER